MTQMRRRRLTSISAAPYLSSLPLERSRSDIRHMCVVLDGDLDQICLIFEQEPIFLRFWVVTLACVFLALIGVGLEIAQVISKDNDGASRVVFDLFMFFSEPMFILVSLLRRLLRPYEERIFVCIGAILNGELCAPCLPALLILPAPSRSSPLSCSFHLRLWFTPWTGTSGCGMYENPPLANPPRLTITTAVHPLVTRSCLGRRDHPIELRRLTPSLSPFPTC